MEGGVKIKGREEECDGAGQMEHVRKGGKSFKKHDYKKRNHCR